jgi:NTP pyrophosphatase (non-canonical NTP hydrolase)
VEEKEMLDLYAEWTNAVAKYPPTAEPFYLALGIADECGELAAAILPEDIILEAGDVLWYCARYSTRVLGIPFSQVAGHVMPMDPYLMAHPPMRYAGIICGVEKKRIRDGEFWDAAKLAAKNHEAHGALLNLLSWVLWNLKYRNSSFKDAIEQNVNKLSGRLEAGTIRGDGDKR